jgi:DNA replication and repair protein RecF
MALEHLEVQHFRCLNDVSLDLHPGWNLFTGPNASGKTSLLEALFFLGRGRSFRGVPNRQLVQGGESGLTTFGRVSLGDKHHRLGAGWADGELRCRKDGEELNSASELAATFPSQVLDPEAHQLVSGSPHHRRRFLDWMVFHVEPLFLGAWKRYQQALRQRNAALRTQPRALAEWDLALAAAGTELNDLRSSVMASLVEEVPDHIQRLTGLTVSLELQPGWSGDDLASSLAASLATDREAGFTHPGPHRADIAIRLEGRRARDRLSRGQEKLVAIAMVLAQLTCLARFDRYPALLVDDPAAELDAEHLAGLLETLKELGNQLFITSLNPSGIALPSGAPTFHVERGVVTPA